MVLNYYYDINNEKLHNAWKKMEVQSSPFLYYDYVKYVWQQVIRFSGYIPRIVCVESQPHGEILMIIPLRWNICKRFYKMLCDISGCGKADVLYDPSLSDEKKEICVEYFYRHIGQKCCLRRLPFDSPLLFHIQDENKKTNKQTCVKIDFIDGADSLLCSLHKSVRQNIRTAYNRLNKDNIDFEINIYRGSEMNDEIWRKIKHIYMDRLLSKYKTHAKQDTFQKIVHYWKYYYSKHDTRSLRQLPNSFHSVLMCKGEVMAFLSGFMSENGAILVVPRLSINDKYRFYSPGYILIIELLKYLSYKTNCTCLDLSRGEEQYKFDLGGTPYYTVSYSFSPL
jgi:hypothetical protein